MNLTKYLSPKDIKAMELKARRERLTFQDWVVRTLQDVAESRTEDDGDVRMTKQEVWEMGYMKLPISYPERVMFTQEAKKQKLSMELWMIQTLNKEVQTKLTALREYMKEKEIQD